MEGIVGDVLDVSRAAAAREVGLEGGIHAGPDLDAGAVGGVGHARVVDVEVLDDVERANVLAEGADGDAVGAVADEVLNDNVCRVGLEGDAVVAVVDDGVLDDDAVGAVGVPAVGVLGRVGGGGADLDVDVGDEDVGAVCDEVEPLFGGFVSGCS